MVVRLCTTSLQWHGRNRYLWKAPAPIPRPRRFHSRPLSCRRRSSVYNTLKVHEDDSHLKETEETLKEEENEEGLPKGTGTWSRVKQWFAVDKRKLQDLGIGAFIAYGFVSNVNSGIMVVIAWLSHVKQTGMIPFAKGQWKAFLAVYAGLWAVQNFLRPIRIAAAIALTPLVNSMLKNLVEKLGIKRRQAVLLMFIGLAVFTMSSLVSAIWILGGIPSRVPQST